MDRLAPDALRRTDELGDTSTLEQAASGSREGGLAATAHVPDRGATDSRIARGAVLDAATAVKVDVGIPTLGNSPYLVETIKSVIAQTHTNWTLTISENGPGLSSVRRELEPFLGDPRVHHLVTGEKLGRGSNHNVLIRRGNAPYVGIVHDDDRWHPEFLARRVAFMEENPTCGLVYSGHVVIDDTGKALGRTRLTLPAGVHSSAEVLPILYRRNFIGCPTVLVRRTAYEAVGSKYEDILNYDIPMWLRIAAKFDIGCLATWDADYRHHGGQASARRLRLAEEEFRVLEAVDDLPISNAVKRQVLAETHIRCALDAVERGERGIALSHVRSAATADPMSLIRPRGAARTLAVAAASLTGSPGRRIVTRARQRRWHTGGLDPMPTSRT